MASVSFSYGSTQKVSLYDRTTAWRMKQREHNETYLSQAAATASLFTTNSNSTQSMTELVFQQVTQRLQEEANARIAEQNDSLNSILESFGSVDVTA